MNKYLTAISSLIIFIIGFSYLKSDGLILEISNGNKIYSNSLMSSGSNDSFLMSIGFMSFIVTFIISILSFLKVVSTKALGWAYSINFVILVFITFLVNMDVSVYSSIKYGDYVLMSGFIISIIPFILLALLPKQKPKTIIPTRR